MNYVFRIAMKNKTDNNYFVDLKVEGNEDHFCGKFNVILKNEKKENLICNLHSLNLDSQFENLKIYVRIHKYQNILDKFFYKFQNEEYRLVYTHCLKPKE